MVTDFPAWGAARSPRARPLVATCAFQTVLVRNALVLGALVCAIVLARRPETSPRGAFDRGDNGLWMRRHWIHGGIADPERASLAAALEARGIGRIYPFLGPMDADGTPGWRDRGVIRHYDPARAGAFFAEMQRLAPGVKVIPWTGGNLRQDVRLDDARLRAAFATHMKAIVDLGADGVQLNVEPLPDGTRAYLDFLREVKAAIGPDKILSVAAYPPATDLHPFPDVHWSLAFTAEVCAIADEMAFMAYDTALPDPRLYEGLVADWTSDLARTLPDHCHWSIGVPAYEDDEPWHRPGVETISHGIAGVRRGLARLDAVPATFTGIAVYASWTTDAEEWATFDREWRGL